MNGETVLGLLMVVVWLINWGLAGMVYLAAPRRSVNRWLSIVLFVEGASLGAFGLMNIGVGGPGAVQGFVAVHIAAWIPVTWLYMVFISRALVSPLARAAGHPVVILGLATYTSVMVVLYFRTSPDLWLWDPPRLWALAFTMLAATGTYALLAALQAFRGTTGVKRAQVRAYLLAFAARDSLFVAMLVALPAYLFWEPLVGTSWLAWNFALAAAMLVFVSLLTYGILKTQLFDIDLKVKWTLKRGTVVAALAAVFFIVKEGVEALLPLEGLVPSLAGATLVAGLAYPAWRSAAQITQRLMPGVEDTKEYRAARGREIYRAAVVDLAGAGISPSERRVLDAFRTRLGITAAVAATIENEVRQSERVDAFMATRGHRDARKGPK